MHFAHPHLLIFINHPIIQARPETPLKLMRVNEAFRRAARMDSWGAVPAPNPAFEPGG
jgi:hypothetical protein